MIEGEKHCKVCGTFIHHVDYVVVEWSSGPDGRVCDVCADRVGIPRREPHPKPAAAARPAVKQVPRRRRGMKCPECDGKGEVLDAPAYGDCHTYWATCLDCGGTGERQSAPAREGQTRLSELARSQGAEVCTGVGVAGVSLPCRCGFIGSPDGEAVQVVFCLQHPDGYTPPSA